MSALPPLTAVESNDPVETPRRVALVRPDTRPSIRRSTEKFVMAYPHLIIREVILFQVVVIFLTILALVFNAPLEGIANPVETPNPAKAPWYFLGMQELLHYFPPFVAGVLIPGLVVVALGVIPYARVNLTAGPLWEGSDEKKTAILVGGIASALVLFFGGFLCWAAAVPTAAVAAAMFMARGGAAGGRWRQAMARLSLPQWIMTWFVVLAAVLTIIGTYFRGPGWSFVWPWTHMVHS